MLVAVTAVSGVMAMFSPATTPAQAVPHDVCAGALGTADLGSPLHYPGLRSTTGTTTSALHVHPHSTTFVFHIQLGTCATTGTQFSAAGSVHGWCGLSVGSGITSQGDNFHWVAVGGQLVVTGEAKGVVNAVPNPATDSCVAGADDFITTGAVVRQSCGVVNQPSLSVASISLPNTSIITPTHTVPDVHVSGHLSSQYSLCY